MAKLIIADLEEDAELDAAAMGAVSGGRRGGPGSLRGLEQRYRTQATFERSAIVPGLVKVGNLREGLPDEDQ